MSRLLLLSNSTNPGGRYLGHTRAAIKRFLGREGRNALLVPYAGVRIDWDEYHRRVAEALAPIGVRVRSIHHARDPRRARHLVRRDPVVGRVRRRGVDRRRMASDGRARPQMHTSYGAT